MQILIFWLFIYVPVVSYSQKEISEVDYSNYIQQLIGGEHEYSVQSGRVDLVTNEFAYDIEWARNWKETIGQCLWFALQRNLKPGIILIRKMLKIINSFRC